MSKAAAPSSSSPPVDAAEVRQSIAGKHVCPFCGVLRTDPNQPCARCTLDDTAATRQATKQRIGPWFVLQARNPSAPGMKLATLQSLVRRGHLTPRSIVRGPTTEQMWAFVATVRGLSREFGLCYHCGEAIEPTAPKCPHCARGQELPPDPDALLESATPVTAVQPAPLFAPPPAPVPPADFLSTPLARPDTGMDGGTSLDLQADALFPLATTRPPAAAPRPAPVRPAPAPRPLVQRAAVPTKDEAILTARELAAAFQLDFNPPGTRGSGPRRGPVRTLAGLLVIVAVAATIVLALRSDWRREAFAWTVERWGTVAASLERPAKPPAGTGGSTGGLGGGPSAVPLNPVPPVRRETPRPAPVPSSTPVTPRVEPAKVEPKPEPAPPPRLVEVPAPAPVVVAPAPAPPAALPPVEDMSIEQATTLASDLRLKAMDAQARNDWPAALRSYEQIERLPRDAWPADLPLRLDIARRKVGAP